MNAGNLRLASFSGSGICFCGSLPSLPIRILLSYPVIFGFKEKVKWNSANICVSPHSPNLHVKERAELSFSFVPHSVCTHWPEHKTLGPDSGAKICFLNDSLKAPLNILGMGLVKKFSKELSKEHSKEQHSCTRIGPLPSTLLQIVLGDLTLKLKIESRTFPFWCCHSIPKLNSFYPLQLSASPSYLAGSHGTKCSGINPLKPNQSAHNFKGCFVPHLDKFSWPLAAVLLHDLLCL